MNDRLPIRDRTLILRILVPGLETRLRDKMKETANQASKKESILDLDGVTCEPSAARNSTLWSFHCDGATYPAKLVNLPCPVEIQKTLDHASFYKCSDVAQMLIVYEDEMALEEAEEQRPIEGYPSYYHSGLTPPMKRVVERRFKAREHASVAPPRAVVQDVENVIIKLMEELANNEKTSNKRNKAPVLTTANKDFVEIEEEIVYYEPWMSDQSGGVEFEAGDPQSQYSLHPEVWLSAETIQKIREEEEEEANKKKQKAQSKATAKKQNKPPKEKEKKAVNRTELVETDQVTDAALAMMSGEVNLEGDDLFEDFEFDTSEMEAIDMGLS